MGETLGCPRVLLTYWLMGQAVWKRLKPEDVTRALAELIASMPRPVDARTAAKVGPAAARGLLQALVAERRRRKLRPFEVAASMGILPQALARLETCHHNPRLLTVMLYAAALGVEIRVLFPDTRTSTRASKRR